MTWQEQIKGDPLPWLLERDTPGARYLALRDLLDLPEDDPRVSGCAPCGSSGRANRRYPGKDG